MPAGWSSMHSSKVGLRIFSIFDRCVVMYMYILEGMLTFVLYWGFINFYYFFRLP